MGNLVGVDEVGRGCLAGPLLVVAARAYGDMPVGLKDSKLLTKTQRERLFSQLRGCCAFGEGWVKPIEIDSNGLAKALRLGVARALRMLVVSPDETVMMDGSVNYAPKKFINSTAMINGDNLVPIISAASIYAKVTRDRFMNNLAKKYPAYEFEKHVGYGTKTHMLAIRANGALKYVHRYSFTPIASISGAEPLKQPSKVYKPSPPYPPY